MGGGPTISQQKIIAAAQGNPDLLEVLQQMHQVAAQQQSVTSTTPVVQKPTGSPAAPVPAQATGSVSILGAAYVVQLINPGGKSPISQIQAAQAAGNAGAAAPLQPVTPIFHQIRASTSPAFNVNSNTQVFGGNTGSVQNYWTITGLGSGNWYFQFRSSFDGVNWNQWKNANSGAGLGGLINQVTTESAANSDWALFNLPGKMAAGFGAGLVPDQGTFGLPAQLVSSGLFAIAGPDGFVAQNNGISGMRLADVEIQNNGEQVTTVSDFPVEIRMQMALSGGFNLTPAIGTVFAFGFYPVGDNVTFFVEPAGGGGAVWAVFRLPGGARMAWGQGNNLDGESIWTPPSMPWITPVRMMSMCSMTATPQGQPVITGYGECGLSGLAVQARYLNDSGGLTPVGVQRANWLVCAWELGADIVMAGGLPFLQIQLQGGHALIVASGVTPSGTAIVLPPGYTSKNMLSACIPNGSANSGHHMRGVTQCGFQGLTPYLQYTDNNNFWDGPVQWFLAAWK